MQDESIHRNSFNQDKGFSQLEKRLNGNNGKRNPDLNNNDTTFKPKYFANFTSDVNPQTAPINHNSIKFNEKNISGVSYTDVYQKDDNLAEIKQENEDNDRDPEFLNTLMRLKGKDTPILLSSLNENFISKSITNLQNICLDDSKMVVKDLNDLGKADRTQNDLFKSGEIEGISRIENKSSSNLLNDTRSIFSSSKIFRISSPELLESIHLEAKISNSSEKKKNSDSKNSQGNKKNRVLISSIEKGQNLQCNNDKFTKIKKDFIYCEKMEETANKEAIKGSKIFVMKTDKNMRYSGIDIEEGTKKDSMLMKKDKNIKKTNFKERVL